MNMEEYFIDDIADAVNGGLIIVLSKYFSPFYFDDNAAYTDELPVMHIELATVTDMPNIESLKHQSVPYNDGVTFEM